MSSTGKYIWMLGKPSMTKRAGGIAISNNDITTTDDTKSCQTCVCCSKSQVDLHNAKAIVFCCMDFRLRDNMSCQLNLKGYRDNYDEVISAGASLGYNGLIDYVDWSVYVDNHIKLSYKLHNISEIIIIDHEKCGAYTTQYGALTLEREYELHIENEIMCANKLWDKFNPINGTNEIKILNLVIIAYIFSIDGCNLTEIYRKSS